MATTRNGRHSRIFQVRTGLGDDPVEVLTRLTHQVWRDFEERDLGRAVDPHLWPEIFRMFRNVFKNRLTYHPECGARDVCLDIPCLLCGRKAHTHSPRRKVYLLELNRSLTSFLSVVSRALARRLAFKKAATFPGRSAVSDALEESITRSLREHFFLSDICAHCPVRESPSDRRIWDRDEWETPWGGWRDILPEEVLIGADREDS